jgi:hypothetical protein
MHALRCSAPSPLLGVVILVFGIHEKVLSSANPSSARGTTLEGGHSVIKLRRLKCTGSQCSLRVGKRGRSYTLANQRI